MPTAEGERIRPAASDLMRRYAQFQALIDNNAGNVADLAVACRLEAVIDIMLSAVKRFRKQYPHWRLSISTPPGKARVQGLATSVYDLIIVTHEPSDHLTEEEHFFEELDPRSRYGPYSSSRCSTIHHSSRRLEAEQRRGKWHLVTAFSAVAGR